MRENVVFYVTRQYMKKNRKRTLTAFFGIFFMVMLMTCVFVGKETAFDFLERMAVLDRGKWHVAMYDLKPEECYFIDDSPLNVEGALCTGMRGSVFDGDVERLRRELGAAGVPVKQ